MAALPRRKGVELRLQQFEARFRVSFLKFWSAKARKRTMGEELPVGFDSIFRDGYRAGIAGTARCANPHKGDSHTASIWFDGWDAGRMKRGPREAKPRPPESSSR
jgi:ribosome modulation factor